MYDVNSLSKSFDLFINQNKYTIAFYRSAYSRQPILDIKCDNGDSFFGRMDSFLKNQNNPEALIVFCNRVSKNLAFL